MKKELYKFLLICPLALLTLIIPSLFDNSVFIVISLLCVSFLMLIIDWNYKYLILYLAIFVSGPIAEAIAIYFGVWTYTNPVFIGVPMWLPFVWGNAGLYIIRLKALIDIFLR